MQDIGDKERKNMKKVKYTDEPLGRTRRVENFLPSPDKLVFKEDTEKVLLSLTKSSVDFFKEEAKKNRVPYQKMIRNLVDDYARTYRGHL